MSADPAWIAADWGSSHLRLWLMDEDGGVLERRQSDRGASALDPDGFGAALTGLLGADRPGAGLVICCGMAGAREGWAEAPHAAVPCPPLSAAGAAVVFVDGLRVHLLPGLKQAAPADVMRGEETQIAGVLADAPDFDGVLCLPGTHTKWAHVSAGEVVSFRTFMTGELFALLTERSVLRHAMGSGGWDEAAFAAALDRAMSGPAGVAADLFAIRAEDLLQGLPPGAARARASGLLIGLELAAARPYWLGRDIRIVGEAGIAAAYRAALAAQGVPAATVPAETATLAGLVAAHARIATDAP
jgi:2-dehydro-3-deoxygalactonokinase